MACRRPQLPLYLTLYQYPTLPLPTPTHTLTLDAHPTADQEFAGLTPHPPPTPARLATFFLDHEILSTVILSLPLIHKGSFWQKNVQNTGLPLTLR